MAVSKSLSYVILVTTVLGTLILLVEGRSVQEVEDPAVTRFREYLRINSAHPNPTYEGCIEWLREQAEDIGLEFRTEYYEYPDSFAVILTWNGTNPGLKSILLDSHMDVVAVDPSKWVHPPFDAYKDEQGNIFARGAIDMKATTAAVLESIRRLKASDFQPLRTVYMIILPDEELYSRGVKGFVNSTTFRDMNIGFALDEVTVNPGDDLLITYAEKSVWQFNITVYGMAAHASLLPEMTAGQKLNTVISRFMEFRNAQLDQLQDPNVTMQNITSVNLVRVGGGLGNNIIPDELWAQFDMRLAIKPGWNFSDVENMINGIIAESGNDTRIIYLTKTFDYAQTPTDDTNIWWVQLQQTCRQRNVTCRPNIPNGVTDGRYIRAAGVPLFGLSGFLNTPPLAHQTDEHINENNWLDGIDRFGAIIQNFASVPEEVHP